MRQILGREEENTHKIDYMAFNKGTQSVWAGARKIQHGAMQCPCLGPCRFRSEGT